MTKRARTDTAKADRQQDIVHAAADLFAAVELEAFTMDAVAERLGLAKGTLYRYFPTREALLLCLLDEEFLGWFTDLGSLVAQQTPMAFDDLAIIITRSICVRPSFVRLNGALSALLERNIPVDTALTFKLRLLERTSAMAEAVNAALPAISPENAVRLFIQLHAAVVGLHSCAFPAPVVAEVLQDDRLRSLRLDFETELDLMVRSLVNSAAHPTTTSTTQP